MPEADRNCSSSGANRHHPPGDEVLCLQVVRRSFGEIVAVDGIDLSVCSGELLIAREPELYEKAKISAQ